MPHFSLAVPTYRRADTLRHTLETLLSQTERDVEIVVQNNGNDEATRLLLVSLDDPRVKHFHSDDVVSMTENWELALSNCSGELITVVGDDDGLFPDACRIAGAVFDGDGVELLSWAPFLYLWPSYWDERRRNRLEARVSFESKLQVELSRPWLEKFYAFRASYSTLPMIYNSFVSRSLIERVRHRYGKYFFGSLPDVTSGIMNATESETFLKLTRPLSITGISAHSCGHRLTRAETRFPRAEFERHFPQLAEEADPGPDSNLEWLIAIEMRLMEEYVLRERSPITLDERRLAWAMAAGINESPSRYDDTRSAILSLMRRFKIPEGEIEIPSRASHPPAPDPGVHVDGPYQILLVLDGNPIGIRTIADAVRLASQIIPSVNTDTLARGASEQAPAEKSPALARSRFRSKVAELASSISPFTRKLQGRG